jgi:hypothetical protein
MWITVENTRNSVEDRLGISQEKVKGFKVINIYPHLFPQLSLFRKSKNLSLTWKENCNYKKVILLTHISTAVITTNFKYKTFSWRVRPLNTQVAKVAAI